MKPPITHRDLKIENILLNQKRFKLCDFGSCSTDYVDLTYNISSYRLLNYLFFG